MQGLEKVLEEMEEAKRLTDKEILPRRCGKADDPMLIFASARFKSRARTARKDQPCPGTKTLTQKNTEGAGRRRSKRWQRRN